MEKTLAAFEKVPFFLVKALVHFLARKLGVKNSGVEIILPYALTPTPAYKDAVSEHRTLHPNPYCYCLCDKAMKKIGQFYG